MFAFKVLQRTDAETSGVYLAAIKKVSLMGHKVLSSIRALGAPGWAVTHSYFICDQCVIS